MLLNKLRMVNFKRFRDEEIVFHDGITGIVGNNGAGKSTMVEAILFALYGIRSSSLESEYLVSASAGEKEKCTVSLDFNAGGVPYTVTRTFRKTAHSIQHQAQLVMGDDTLLADGVSRVEEEIPRIIGTGPRDFQNTIYSGQKDLRALLDETPGERQKWFMHVLGIDVIKQEGDKEIAEDISRDRERLRQIRYYLEQVDPASLDTEIEEAVRRERAAGEKLREIRERRSSLQSREETLGKEEKHLTAQKEEMIRLSSELDALRKEKREQADRLQTHETMLGVLYGNRNEARDLEESEARYNELARRRENLQNKKISYDSLTNDIDSRRRMLDHLAHRKEEIRDALSALEEERKRCAELEPVVERRHRMESDLRALRDLEEKVRPLREELRKREWQEKDLEDQAHVVREEIAALEERGAGPQAVATARAHLEEYLSARDEISREQNRLEERLAQIRERITGERTRRDEIREAGPDGACPTCTRPLGDQYARILAGIEDQISALENACRRDEAMHRDCGSRLQQYETSIEAARKHVETAEQDARDLEAARKRRQELMDTMMDCLSRQESLKEEIEATGYAPDKLEEYESGIRATEDTWREYLACSERLKQEEREQERMRDVETRIRKEEGEVARLEGEREALGFDMEEFEAIRAECESLEPVHARYSELQDALRDLPRIEEEAESARQRIREIDDRTARLQEQMTALGSPDERLREVERELASCRQEIVECSGALSAQQKEIESARTDLERLRGERNKVDTLKKESDDLDDRIVLEEITRRVLRDFITYLLQIVQSQIEGDVSAILAEITDGRYDQVVISDDFTPLVADMGEHFPISRFSGGEQDVIAVALRIALSRYLSRLHGTYDATFLIFDEIFGSQDEQRRTNLTRALRTQEMHFPQIFLISHVSDLQGEFAHTLLVERTSEEESRIREVGA